MSSASEDRNVRGDVIEEKREKVYDFEEALPWWVMSPKESRDPMLSASSLSNIKLFLIAHIRLSVKNRHKRYPEEFEAKGINAKALQSRRPRSGADVGWPWVLRHNLQGLSVAWGGGKYQGSSGLNWNRKSHSYGQRSGKGAAAPSTDGRTFARPTNPNDFELPRSTVLLEPSQDEIPRHRYGRTGIQRWASCHGLVPLPCWFICGSGKSILTSSQLNSDRLARSA